MTRPALVLWIAAGLCGCAAGTPLEPVRPTVGPAGGFYLELWVLGEQNLAVIYRVNGKGRIGFGGGVDARNREISWAGAMAPQELEALRVLLGEQGWYDGRVVAAPEPRKRINRIDLRWEGKRRTMTVRGASPEVEPVRAFLDQAARQRLEPDLEALPKPRE